MDTAERRLGAAMVLLGAALWGTAGVASRWIHEAGTAGALEIGFWRLALALPLLLLLSRAIAGPLPSLDRPLILRLAGMGVALAAFQYCYFGAIAAVGVAVATLVGICTIPIAVALLAIPVYGERLGSLGVLAMGLAIAGTTALILGAHSPEIPGAAGMAWGIPLALGACLSFALLTLASRGVSGHMHPLWTTSVTCGLGALLLGFGVLVDGAALPDPSGNTWWILAWIALLPTALAYVLFYTGVRAIPSRLAGILILGEPLTATLGARLLHGESLTIFGWLGAGLLALAMVIMARRQ